MDSTKKDLLSDEDKMHYIHVYIDQILLQTNDIFHPEPQMLTSQRIIIPIPLYYCIQSAEPIDTEHRTSRPKC